MKSIHANKLFAIINVKTRALFSKNFIIMPLFTIGFTFIMKIVYGSINIETDMSGYILGLGAVMNIGTVGVYCVSATLAEEKEKNTLRTLMTSSVNGLEFFLGSIIPVIMMMVIINFILIPISGCSFDIKNYLIYGLLSLVCSITSCMIGMMIGIFAKNQVTASTLTTPIILMLMMVPMFSRFNQFSELISQFLFTGILLDTIDLITAGAVDVIDWLSIVILVVEIVVSVIVFIFIYRKNGYEKE